MTPTDARLSDVRAIEPGRLYTSAEVCVVFRCCRDTVRRWVRMGKLRTVTADASMGRRFLGSDILAKLKLPAEGPAVTDTAHETAEVRP